MPSPIEMLAIALCVQVAISDAYARRVSNTILICAIGLACVLYAAGFHGAVSIGEGLLGFGVGLVALMPFYALRVMGAGDVKFFAVLGLLLGWKALLPLWVVGSLLAGVYAMAVLSWRRLAPWVPPHLQLAFARWPACGQVSGQLRRARQGREGIPYATCLAAGAMAWMVWG